MRWYQIPHFLHALWWMLVAFGAVYFFFSEEGMNWQIDLITACLFAPFIGVAVLVYRLMFRKKTIRNLEPSVSAPSFDPIQQARNKAH